MGENSTKREERESFVEKYFGAIIALFTKADKTAEGTTDDKTPEEPAQVEGFNSMETDARELANFITSKVRPKTIAELLVTQMVYNTAQAQTRLTKKYNTTRKDCYEAANKLVESRKEKAKTTHALYSSLVKASAYVEKALAPNK